MDRSDTTEIRCPACAGTAHVTVRWNDTGFETAHGEVVDFDCAHGCEVDPGTLRTMIGAE